MERDQGRVPTLVFFRCRLAAVPLNMLAGGTGTSKQIRLARHRLRFVFIDNPKQFQIIPM
jgi:hypothetical protein